MKPCKIKGCTNRTSGSGNICGTHGYRWQKFHSYDIPDRSPLSLRSKTCYVDGCTRKRDFKLYCKKHYYRWKKHGTTDKFVRPKIANARYIRTTATRAGRKPTPQPREVRLCSVPGCEKIHKSKGFCTLHYSRLRLKGAPGKALPLKAPNGSGHINPLGYKQFN